MKVNCGLVARFIRFSRVAFYRRGLFGPCSRFGLPQCEVTRRIVPRLHRCHRCDVTNRFDGPIIFKFQPRAQQSTRTRSSRAFDRKPNPRSLAAVRSSSEEIEVASDDQLATLHLHAVVGVTGSTSSYFKRCRQSRSTKMLSIQATALPSMLILDLKSKQYTW